MGRGPGKGGRLMVRGGVVVKEGGLGARLAPRDPPKRGTPPPPQPSVTHLANPMKSSWLVLM